MTIGISNTYIYSFTPNRAFLQESVAIRYRYVGRYANIRCWNIINITVDIFRSLLAWAQVPIIKSFCQRRKTEFEMIKRAEVRCSGKVPEPYYVVFFNIVSLRFRPRRRCVQGFAFRTHYRERFRARGTYRIRTLYDRVLGLIFYFFHRPSVSESLLTAY